MSALVRSAITWLSEAGYIPEDLRSRMTADEVVTAINLASN